jgi:hypothetical protein
LVSEWDPFQLDLDLLAEGRILWLDFLVNTLRDHFVLLCVASRDCRQFATSDPRISEDVELLQVAMVAKRLPSMFLRFRKSKAEFRQVGAQIWELHLIGRSFGKQEQNES